jgi:Na+/H+ antiporter NhaD/arsenite permease-like protein
LEQWGIGPEGVAIGCAVLALFLSKLDPADIFKSLDWETIFFIAGFMFLVAGVEKTQVLSGLSNQLFLISGGNAINASLLTLWISGLGSTIISNIAIALTFTPVISAQAFSGMQSGGVWSGLILGTNLGGAATPFSGTVVMMAIGALKREHISIKFTDFAKIGLLTTFLQLGVSSLYLLLRFGV